MLWLERQHGSKLIYDSILSVPASMQHFLAIPFLSINWIPVQAWMEFLTAFVNEKNKIIPFTRAELDNEILYKTSQYGIPKLYKILLMVSSPKRVIERTLQIANKNIYAIKVLGSFQVITIGGITYETSDFIRIHFEVPADICDNVIRYTVGSFPAIIKMACNLESAAKIISVSTSGSRSVINTEIWFDKEKIP